MRELNLPGTVEHTANKLAVNGRAEDSRRYLVIFKSVGFLRHFGVSIEQLLCRGHDVHVFYESLSDAKQYAEDVNRLTAYSNYSGNVIPRFKKDGRDRYRRKLRLTWDYLRYFHPAFLYASFLRKRVEAETPDWIVRLAELGLFRVGFARRAGEAMLRFLEWREPQRRGRQRRMGTDNEKRRVRCAIPIQTIWLHSGC